MYGFPLLDAMAARYQDVQDSTTGSQGGSASQEDLPVAQ